MYDKYWQLLPCHDKTSIIGKKLSKYYIINEVLPHNCHCHNWYWWWYSFNKIKDGSEVVAQGRVEPVGKCCSRFIWEMITERSHT